MDPSILINWTSPFPILGVSGVLFHFYSVSNRCSCKQTVKNLIRRRVLRRPIWVCTVCLCPRNGTLGLYEPRHDKTNKMSVRPAKTQISLGIRPVWSESSLCAQLVAKDPSFLHADSVDQTGRMPRLTWVFAGRTAILLVLSCRGWYG